jgi:glycosyltransferase involved in cell wall biosynthesis
MKKVLIITYYWPPSGGPSVQRVLKFAKYLPIFGWEPIILTLVNQEFPEIDLSLKSDLKTELKVYRTKTIEPFSLYKKFLKKEKLEKIPTFVLNDSESKSKKEKFANWVRTNIFIPDARMGWYPFGVRKGIEIVKKEKIDLIFSSSPPHSLQLIAKTISKKTHSKWVADFRDPWINAFWQSGSKKSKISSKIESSLERMVINSADQLISVSKGCLKELGVSLEKANVIMNGFDHDDFKSIDKIKSEKFRIKYTGTLSKYQPVDSFVESINKLPEEVKKRIHISFIGTFHHVIKEELIKIDKIVEIELSSPLPHSQIVREMINSEVLMLILPNTKYNEGIVTGKIFEYIASRNFILAVGPIYSEVSSILEKTKSGVIYNFEDDFSNKIIELFNLWLNGRPLINDSNIEEFSRKKQTEQLASIFNKSYESK